MSVRWQIQTLVKPAALMLFLFSARSRANAAIHAPEYCNSQSFAGLSASLALIVVPEQSS